MPLLQLQALFRRGHVTSLRSAYMILLLRTSHVPCLCCRHLVKSSMCCVAGFKTSALRKRFLPWYARPLRVTKTTFVSSLTGCLADWTVTSYIDLYRRVCKHCMKPAHIVSTHKEGCNTAKVWHMTQTQHCTSKFKHRPYWYVGR